MSIRHQVSVRLHHSGRVVGAALTFVGLLASLLVSGASVASAAYPGADGKIAFVRANQVYTVNPDGTGMAQLTNRGKNHHPKWSPDGTQIAYVHQYVGGAKDIWLMSASGSDKHRVTHLRSVTEPTWSPDGRWLAFASGGGLMRVDTAAPSTPPQELGGTYSGCTGCDPTYVDNAIDVDRFLAWSPDGTKIAVYNHWDGRVDDTIYMYDLASHNAAKYAGIGAACCGFADWSDLAFGPAGQFGYADIVRDSNGANPQPSKIVYPGYVGKPGDRGPTPAPANQRIALTNASSGGPRVYVQALDGSNRSLVTRGHQPDWQPRP